jgi:protein SCO1/2
MNRRAMTMHLPIRAALAAALLLSAGACHAPAEAPPLAGAAVGGPFTLTDKAGKRVRWDDFAGRYRIVYFGYSFCPDACPTDVGVMIRGLDRFTRDHPAAGAQIQPIFITIDPARDTPAVVGQFAAAFSPRLLGLTGSAAEVDQAAKAFGAYYAKGKAVPGGYLMDHSRIAYLMGRQGEPIAMLPVDKGPAEVAQELAKWVK